MNMEKLLKERLQMMKNTSTTTHIISCPFENTDGKACAKNIAETYAGADDYSIDKSMYCSHRLL